jgi:hypothetical protein
MARRFLTTKVCTGECNKKLPRSAFSPGQGKCRTCRWEHRQHILKEKVDPARVLERKKARIADLEVVLGQSVCTACEKQPSSKDHVLCDKCRLANRERQRDPKTKTKAKARIQPVIDWMTDLKLKTPCTDCKQFFTDPKQLDWDHLPEYKKVAQVSYYVTHGNRKKAEAEMKKCELVCKSCHTKRGIIRGQIVRWQ